MLSFKGKRLKLYRIFYFLQVQFDLYLFGLFMLDSSTMVASDPLDHLEWARLVVAPNSIRKQHKSRVLTPTRHNLHDRSNRECCSFQPGDNFESGDNLHRDQ